MLSLMLDPIFKSFYCVSSFINCEQMKAIVEEYNTKFLYPCFKNVIIIYTHWLNLEVALLYLGSLWIGSFWFSTNIKLISRTSNVLFNGGKNIKLHFKKIGFLTHHILGIVGSQIKTKFLKKNWNNT